MRIPFYDWRVWLRALVKGVALLLIFDMLFIMLRPFDAIQPLSLYNTLLPSRTRLILPVSGDANYQLMPLETLFRAHQREVYGWIVRVVRDRAAAEDLTIETFWRAYRSRSRFDPARSYLSFSP